MKPSPGESPFTPDRSVGDFHKLVVAILSQDALPVATELLQSGSCEDRQLGLQILKNMDLLVTRTQIDELSNQIGRNLLDIDKTSLAADSLHFSTQVNTGTFALETRVPELPRRHFD